LHSELVDVTVFSSVDAMAANLSLFASKEMLDLHLAVKSSGKLDDVHVCHIPCGGGGWASDKGLARTL
jgi:hypothetical protein